MLLIYAPLKINRFNNKIKRGWFILLNTQITFTIGDLIYLLFSVLGIGVLVYLIFFLKELYIALKNLNVIYIENKDNINTIITEATEITKKSNNVLEVFSNDVEKVSVSIAEFIPKINAAISVLKMFFGKK